MGIRFGTNPAALGPQRQTEETAHRLLAGMERLATGARINRSADDAAGLAIAERLRADVLQSNREASNLQEGVNVIQTAEGALGAQEEGVQRLRELALQAANGTLTEDQRGAIQAEAQQVIEQVNTIANETEFNGIRLLNGTAGPIELGVEGGGQINIGTSTAASLGVNAINLGTPEEAAAAVETVNNALSSIGQNRAGLGAQENRLSQAIEQRETVGANQEEALSRIRDLDVARQTIDQARNQILLEGGIAALVQGNIGAQAAARLLGR
jgi:flagellin